MSERKAIHCHPVCIQIDPGHRKVLCSSFDRRVLCRHCSRYYKVFYDDGHIENSKAPVEVLAPTSAYCVGYIDAKIEEERRSPRKRDCDVKVRI